MKRDINLKYSRILFSSEIEKDTNMSNMKVSSSLFHNHPIRKEKKIHRFTISFAVVDMESV